MEAIGAIILAGGKSSRFGTDKALFPIQGIPLIQHVISTVESITKDIIIITNTPGNFGFVEYPCYKDIFPNVGPLGGIYTGLMHTTRQSNLVLPCDMPFISPMCLKYLIENADGNDVTVPFLDKKLEPLCAIYSKKCLPLIEKQIHEKNYQIFQFYDKVNTKKISINAELPFYDRRIFSNINTRHDLLQMDQ